MQDKAVKDEAEGSPEDDQYKKDARDALAMKVFVCSIVCLLGLGIIYDTLEYLVWLTGLTVNAIGENAIIGISVIVWGIIMYNIIPKFTLNVPSITGIITTNTITGRQYWYRIPGVALRYPWEREDGSIKIGQEIVITSGENPLDDKVEPETISTKDGSVTVSYGFIMKTNVKSIGDALEFTRLDDEGRAAIFKQIVSQFLADYFIDKNEEEALKKKSEVSQEMVNLLTADGQKGKKLQEEFKVTIRNPELYQVDTPPDIKKARNQEAIAPMRHIAMRRLFGKGDKEPLSNDEIKLALAAEGVIDYEVRDIKGLENFTGGYLPQGALSENAKKRGKDKTKPEGDKQ